MFGKGDQKKEKRFIIKEQHGIGMCSLSIIRDTVTGVNYLASFGSDFDISCITPLLDGDGNVVIDKNMPEI